MSKTLESLREPVACWVCDAWGEVQYMCDYAPKAFDIAYGMQCFLCPVCTTDEDAKRTSCEQLAQVILGSYGQRPLLSRIRIKRHDQEAHLRNIVLPPKDKTDAV